MINPENTDSRTSSDNLLYVLLQGKWSVIGGTLLSACLAIYLALSTPDTYRAEVLLAPAEAEGAGGLSGLASQFGGLAGLAGISLPTGESNKVGEALALLTSRTFIQSFIEQRELLPHLLALQSWDRESDEIIYDPSVYDSTTATWVRTPPKNKAVIPTPWEGYTAFTELLEVDELDKDGTLTIVIETQSPSLSKQWLEWLVEDLNSTIANKEMSEAKRSIDYLKQQIANTQVQELQSIFFSLIEEQTKKILLGEVREDYVFKVLAAPVLPEDRSAPNRALITVVVTFLGGILTVILVIIISILRRID